jgi:hypothetical protein
LKTIAFPPAFCHQHKKPFLYNAHPAFTGNGGIALKTNKRCTQTIKLAPALLLNEYKKNYFALITKLLFFYK